MRRVFLDSRLMRSVVLFGICLSFGSLRGALTSYPLPNLPSSLAAAPFVTASTLDGIAVMSYNAAFLGQLTIFSNNNDGTFTQSQLFTFDAIGFVAAGDYFYTGNQELAVILSNASGNIQTYLNNGSGSFTHSFQPLSVSFSNGAACLATGSFSTTGKHDLAVANNRSNSITFLIGNISGRFTAPYANLALNGVPTGIANGQIFNTSGLDDIVVSYGTTNNIEVFENQGSGSFISRGVFSVGTNPIGIAVGDFNGDGKLDVAVACSNSNSVSVLINNGTTLQAAVSYSVGNAPVSLVSVDLNGNGKLDLAVANQGSSEISTLSGNGDGTFQAAVNQSANSGPLNIVSGKLTTSSSTPFLCVSNVTGGTISVSN